jgi:hypothetical protein
VGEKKELEGGSTVLVDHLDCTGDSMTVHFAADPPEPVEWKLRADGDRLVVLDAQLDETTGKGRTTAYPLMKTQRALTIELAQHRAKAVVEVVLP